MADEKLLAEWFWIDRWVGSSAFSLPIDARGLYREMLTQAWRRGARLPNDHDQIRRMTGVTMREWKKLWPKVKRFWTVNGSYLVNATQVVVYADAKSRAEKATNRGIRGAQARAQALLKQRLSHAQATPEHKPLITSHQSLEEPPVVPLAGGRLTKRELRAATDIRNRRFGRCAHDPACASADECIRAIALDVRAKKARAS